MPQLIPKILKNKVPPNLIDLRKNENFLSIFPIIMISFVIFIKKSLQEMENQSLVEEKGAFKTAGLKIFAAY